METVNRFINWCKGVPKALSDFWGRQTKTYKVLEYIFWVSLVSHIIFGYDWLWFTMSTALIAQISISFSERERGIR